MNFGVPSQRQAVKEKYPDTAVITMSLLKGENTARSFVLNPKAVEELELPDNNAVIAFSFDNGIVIVNGNQEGIPDNYKIRVSKTKPRKFSDKRTYEYIVKTEDLDNTVENEFTLEEVNNEGIKGFKFQKIGLVEDVIAGEIAEEIEMNEGEVIPEFEEATI